MLFVSLIVLLIIGLIVFFIHWRKERDKQDEIVFRITAWFYFTLYFYAVLFFFLLIPSMYFDTWNNVVTLGIMYPPLLFLYFSVERALSFWKGVGAICSGIGMNESKKKLVSDGVWLVLAILFYLFLVMLYQLVGFIWLSAFLLAVLVKEFVLNRKS